MAWSNFVCVIAYTYVFKRHGCAHSVGFIPATYLKEVSAVLGVAAGVCDGGAEAELPERGEERCPAWLCLAWAAAALRNGNQRESSIFSPLNPSAVLWETKKYEAL